MLIAALYGKSKDKEPPSWHAGTQGCREGGSCSLSLPIFFKYFRLVLAPLVQKSFMVLFTCWLYPPILSMICCFPVTVNKERMLR